jgi:predicted glycosyltransferase
LTTALAAKPLSVCRDLHWRLLVSPAIAARHFEALQQQADDTTSVERNLPDFGDRIKRARLSISQAGYNTVTDILNSETAAVMIPYAEANEKEQTLRAQILHSRGRVITLAESGLTAASLAEAISSALSLNTKLTVNLDGAKNSATMIAHWLNDAGAAA